MPCFFLVSLADANEGLRIGARRRALRREAAQRARKADERAEVADELAEHAERERTEAERAASRAAEIDPDVER